MSLSFCRAWLSFHRGGSSVLWTFNRPTNGHIFSLNCKCCWFLLDTLSAVLSASLGLVVPRSPWAWPEFPRPSAGCSVNHLGSGAYASWPVSMILSLHLPYVTLLGAELLPSFNKTSGRFCRSLMFQFSVIIPLQARWLWCPNNILLYNLEDCKQHNSIQRPW